MSSASFIRFVVLSVLLSSSTAFGRILDHGVDPENLGRGIWIYYLESATNKLGGNVPSVTDVPSLMKFLKQSGIDFMAVKAATGGEEFPGTPQFTPELVKEAQSAGLKIFGYTRSDGKDVAGEIAIAAKVNDMGADGFIIDAEAEWESHKLEDGPAKAIQLCEGIRKAHPNRFLGHAPFPVISKHSSFPYQEFGYYCDTVMPQAYWKSIGVTPERMVSWMDEEWHAWHASLSGKWTNAIKPLAPIGQGWSPSNDKIVTGAEIMQFVSALNHDKKPASPTGYKGVSYWRVDLHTPRMWRSIEAAKIGDPSTTPESLLQNIAEEPTSAQPAVARQKTAVMQGNSSKFVVDDSSPEVTFTGAWNDGAEGNRFGDTYKTVPTTLDAEPSATAVYRPVFSQRGVYDIYLWYSHHSNRSTRAPWVIHNEDGAITNLVDQTLGGSSWFLLASNVSFAAGTNGFITVANNTAEDAGHFIVADALQFVRKNNAPSSDWASKAPAAGNPDDFVLDDTSPDVLFEGSWYAGKQKQGRFGDSHMCANSVRGRPTATAVYRPNIQNPGDYDVFIWYCGASNRSRRAPWVISTPAGTLTNEVNQTVRGGDWNLIASNISFAAGTNSWIGISNGTSEGAQRVLIADAVRFVRKMPKTDGSGK